MLTVFKKAFGRSSVVCPGGKRSAPDQSPTLTDAEEPVPSTSVTLKSWGRSAGRGGGGGGAGHCPPHGSGGEVVTPSVSPPWLTAPPRSLVVRSSGASLRRLTSSL